MAIGIQNFPNVDNSDLANFPNGNLTDDAMGVNGVPINKLTNGDLQQFFAKLLRDASIVPNGLPDNVTNGFQYNLALQALAYPDSGWLTLANVAGYTGSIQYRKIGGVVYWRGALNALAAQWNTGGTDILAVIPVGFRPATAKTLNAFFIDTGSGAQVPAQLAITGSGHIQTASLPSGNFTNGFISFDDVTPYATL